jgi:hypothetical protein
VVIYYEIKNEKDTIGNVSSNIRCARLMKIIKNQRLKKRKGEQERSAKRRKDKNLLAKYVAVRLAFTEFMLLFFAGIFCNSVVE